MERSDQINDIATALSAAQGLLKDPHVDSRNSHLQNEYASLTAYLKQIRQAFSANGLSLTQLPSSENGAHFLTTVVMHKSGQWFSSKLQLVVGKNDMQGLGSALSYARRYMAGSFAGAADDDDDAEKSKDEHKAQAPPKKPIAPRSPSLNPGPQPAANPRLRSLYELAKEKGWTESQLFGFVKNNFGAAHPLALSPYQHDILVAHLKTNGSAVQIIEPVGQAMPPL